MEFKAQIMDEAAVQRSLARLTHEIIERNKGIDNILLVGIRRRGLPLAQDIAANMQKFEGASCRKIKIPATSVELKKSDIPSEFR